MWQEKAKYEVLVNWFFAAPKREVGYSTWVTPDLPVDPMGMEVFRVNRAGRLFMLMRETRPVWRFLKRVWGRIRGRYLTLRWVPVNFTGQAAFVHTGEKYLGFTACFRRGAVEWTSQVETKAPAPWAAVGARR